MSVYIFAPAFLRQVKKLDKKLIEEVWEKFELFKNPSNRKQLRIHKLHGPLSGCWSFSVNYKIRIVFQYETKNRIVLLAIGDHEIYQ